MRRIVFKCSENMNKYQEIVEFDNDATEEDIQEAFVEWVWQKVGDHYTWYEEEDEDETEY